MEKKTLISIGIVIAIGLAMFFLGYQAGQSQRIGEQCRKVMSEPFDYSSATKDEVELYNFARKECIKKLLK